ncbi:AAA family ATPase [Saccharopolyspora sp. NPDC000995]
MITALRIRNFKCFLDAEFDLRPLTMLTGLNGSGKSTVVQALLLARQATQSPSSLIQLNGPYELALVRQQPFASLPG